MRYALAGERRSGLWLTLRDASAAQLAEVERAARDYLGDEVEAIGRDELRERLRRGDVVLIDVRPAEEYDAGHIEGARSSRSMSSNAASTSCPSDLEVIAYCRGPFCAYAHEAVRHFRPAARRAGSTTAGPSGGWRGGSGDELDGAQPRCPGLLPEDRTRATLFAGAAIPDRALSRLVVIGLALQSAVLILALVPIGAVAGWTRRHPFDLIWNHGLRHLSGAPELPPNPDSPPPRRSSWRRSGCSPSACSSHPASRPRHWPWRRPGRRLRIAHDNELLRSLALLGVWWRRRGTPTPTDISPAI